MGVLLSDDDGPRVPPYTTPVDRCRSIRRLLRKLVNAKSEEALTYKFGVTETDEARSRFWFERSGIEALDAARCYQQILEHLAMIEQAYE